MGARRWCARNQDNSHNRPGMSENTTRSWCDTLLICATILVLLATIPLIALHAYSHYYFLHSSSPFSGVVPRVHRIPKHIFKTGPLPQTHPLVFPVLAAVSRKNPDVRVRYFNDSESANYIASRCGARARKAHDTLLSGSLRADIFRYCALWADGGIYGDLSQRYKVPLHELVDFRRDKLVLVRDKPRHVQYPGITPVQINFMAAVPQHPLMKLALDAAVSNVETRFYGKSSLEPTGPFLMGKLISPGGAGAHYPFKMELEDTGNSLADMRTGRSLVIKKLGGDRKAHARIGNTPRYVDLWQRRELYGEIN